MGSLVPGWDADSQGGLPPKAFEDHPDDDGEPLGYFAKLKSQRLARKSVEYVPSAPQTIQPAPSLNRSSAPLGTGGSPPFNRAASLPVRGISGGATSWNKHQDSPMMNWGEELNSLKRTGGPKHIAPKDDHKPNMAQCHATSWWRTLDSGALNETPDTVEETHAHGGGGGTFIPQFNVAKLATHAE